MPEEKEPTCNELGCFPEKLYYPDIRQPNGTYSVQFVGSNRRGDGPFINELAKPLTLDRLTTRIRAAWEVIRGRSVAVRWYR